MSPTIRQSARNLAQRWVPPRVYDAAKEALFGFRLSDVEDRSTRQDAQIARLRYGDSGIGSDRRPWELADEELQVYSQNGEDGILLFLVSRLAELRRSIVEIGAADGQECNSANLILNWGWSARLIDGDHEQSEAARRFYDARLPADASTPTMIAAFVTCENIDELVGTDCPDVLSIDIDGNDYWVWDALAVDPPIVVVEYNASFGPDRSVVVPYDPAFERFAAHPSGLYHGASLAAFSRLADRRGYVLVGCESHGVNAFFVRRDLAGDLRAMPADEAWRPHAFRLRLQPHADQEAAALGAGRLEEV